MACHMFLEKTVSPVKLEITSRTSAYLALDAVSDLMVVEGDDDVLVAVGAPDCSSCGWP